ncbi:Ig-like domain-containing protein [Cellulomonas sp. JZ18]|uniref:Ig-like domain-containing protein n=1 Tax=Cellulomonas sp. JZ18 TaxID=2654191 RepID=UPI0018AFAB77|nr:Ig-like domain-containing protein [Cellulomonas sp. JZ18]
MRYEAQDAAGGTAGAQVVVTYLPRALDDVREGVPAGTPATVDVVGNDRGALDPTSVRLLDASGAEVLTLTVPGEGTWTVDARTGALTFTPAAGFTGDPSPVRYRVSDVEGNPTEAVARVAYAAATPAPTPGATPAAAPTSPLAVTGGAGLGLAALAALLVLGGAGALVLRRRGAEG